MQFEPAKFLPLLLAVTFTALDFAVQPVADPYAFDVTTGMYVGLCLGQVPMVAAWLVFGRWHFLIRLVIVLASIAGLAGLLDRHINPSFAECLSVLGIFAVGVIIPLVIMRWSGLRMTNPQMPDKKDSDRRWQFTIAGLFVAMTSLGLVLACLQRTAFPWSSALAVLLYCSGFTFVGWVSLTTVWRPRALFVHLLHVLACIVVSTAVGVALSYVEITRPDHWVFAAMMASASVTICAAIAVVHVSGWQAQWRRSPSRREDAGPDYS